MNDVKTQAIGFLIFPGFPMACLTSMIEPLRAANEISGTDTFSWKLVSEGSGKIHSSAGVAFDADVSLAQVTGLDCLILLSPPMGDFEAPRTSNGALRSLERHGCILGGVSGGVFPLTRAGVMASHVVSVHWCYEAAFRSEFPNIEASDQVIEVSNRRFTASGAAAAFDLSLRLIETTLGGDVATEVACWFQHPLMRGEGVRQTIPTFRKTST
ncbi:MAG: AraC family transcriptional regulator, partial [Planktomarina sp.]